MNTSSITRGIKENWKQFSLLVLITAFVGGMVGMERSLLPRLAEKEFGLASKSAMFSFILAFGITKAITNYFTGTLSNKYGRKKLLVTGWLFALPIPCVLMYAPSWNWIIAANVLLGVNQGLSWSSAVVMKIDLADHKNRGLAIGLNEFAGYSAVGLTTFLVAWIASEFGLRPYPFFTGVVFSVCGLVISVFAIRDTRHFMHHAATSHQHIPSPKNIFWNTTLYNRNLSSVVQAGLVNNLNDGMVWGLYPLLLATRDFSIGQIGVITAIYPAFWGIGQLFSGRISDYVSKKSLLFLGMLLQAIILLLLLVAIEYQHFIILSVVLGLGKAMVYPTFTTAIADNTHPQLTAERLGIFRFWRDLGYAIGAVLTGILSDAFGIMSAIFFVGCLTLASALIIVFRMNAPSSTPESKDSIW